jgi:hypothetical protein
LCLTVLQPRADGLNGNEAAADAAAPVPASAEAGAQPAGEASPDKSGEPRAPRKQRGPPEDGIPSKTKVMVANLPYDLREDKVRARLLPCL